MGLAQQSQLGSTTHPQPRQRATSGYLRYSTCHVYRLVFSTRQVESTDFPRDVGNMLNDSPQRNGCEDWVRQNDAIASTQLLIVNPAVDCAKEDLFHRSTGLTDWSLSHTQITMMQNTRQQHNRSADGFNGDLIRQGRCAVPGSGSVLWR